MDYIQIFRRSALLAAILALAACGGGSESDSNAAAPTPAPLAACSGAVKELFVAMQGRYDGVPDPAFATGAGAALTPGKIYQVTLSGQDCSLRFTGDKAVQYSFVFGASGNTASSKLTGFSKTAILQNPASVNLTEHQYNLGIAAPGNTIELERRVKAISGGEVADGDLHLYSIPGSASFGGLSMKAASKR